MRKHNPHHLRIWIPDPSDPRCSTGISRRPMMRNSSAWRALWYLVLLTVLGSVGVLYMLNWERGDVLGGFGPGKTAASGVWGEWTSGGDAGKEGGEDEEVLKEGVHPIEHLMSIAEEQFKILLASESATLHDAAAKYRSKHGRHPPPGFDAWYHYAVEQGAVMIEDFWDQIYTDLAPFWSIEPVVLRKQTHVFSPKISIRDGKVETHTYNLYPKLDVWADMFRALASQPHVHLPDIDIPMNVNDEPAMLVPWETIDTAVSLVRHMLLEPADVSIEYSGLDDIRELTTNFTFDPEWLGPRLRHPASHFGPRLFWSLVRPACPPSSPARLDHTFNDIWDLEGGTSEEHFAAALLPLDLPENTLKGYAKNWTRTTDACEWPNGQGLHAAFAAPTAMSVSQKLFPLFGDTRLSMSSEILIPGTTEWNTTDAPPDSAYTPWHLKANKLFWRGSATEGRDPKRYWQRFHRHRLVSMLNATHVEIAEASIHSGNESTVGIGYAKTFKLLPANEYHLKSQTRGQLAEWVNGWADAAFTDLKCDVDAEGKACPYLDDYFLVADPETPWQEANFKYAVVVDGDSGDGARELVRSLSSGKVTLRASIYRKWFDSRLVPWLHFVPMDNTFVDLYGIMEYFLGTTVDDAARAFSHAVGEVQKHEHHFKTPGSDIEDEIGSHEHTGDMGADPQHHDDSPAAFSTAATNVDSQSGNEPHTSEHSHSTIRERAGDDHDEAAKRIAEASREWAARVLRREDLLIYVYRLLLEYARVVDNRRERLGWVADLVED